MKNTVAVFNRVTDFIANLLVILCPRWLDSLRSEAQGRLGDLTTLDVSGLRYPTLEGECDCSEVSAEKSCFSL
jgi:hypothetical protein